MTTDGRCGRCGARHTGMDCATWEELQSATEGSEIREQAQIAALTHLRAIGWTPENGLSDEALDLPCCDWDEPVGAQTDWDAACNEAVQEVATALTLALIGRG